MDIQELLLKMREEQREDHAALVTKVDAGFSAMTTTMTAHELADHDAFATVDKRLSSVEDMRKALRWLGMTLISVLLMGAADLLFNHIHVGGLFK